jgi:hypothetical protein
VLVDVAWPPASSLLMQALLLTIRRWKQACCICRWLQLQRRPACAMPVRMTSRQCTTSPFECYAHSVGCMLHSDYLCKTQLPACEAQASTLGQQISSNSHRMLIRVKHSTLDTQYCTDQVSAFLVKSTQQPTHNVTGTTPYNHNERFTMKTHTSSQSSPAPVSPRFGSPSAASL